MAETLAIWWFDEPSGVIQIAWATLTLTYSVSTTDTAVKVSISRISCENGLSSAKDMSYTVTCGGTKLVSGTVSSVPKPTPPAAYGNKSVSVSGSKQQSRGHSQGTIRLKLSGKINGDSGSNYVDISVPALASYAVTYHANGGSSTPSSQTKWFGESLTLRTNTGTRSGYSFWHWNTNTSNTGTSYNNGATYTGNDTLDLYAIWNPIITYYANGGSGAPSAQTKTFGQSITLSSVKPSRTGYVFWHWNTNTSNTGTTYSPGATYSSNTALWLYAIWNPTVTFNANGGSGAPSQQTKTYGQALTLSSTVPIRSGYTFLGWGTSSSDTTADYQPGGSYSSESPITLYAIWRKDAVAPTISGISVVRSDSNGDPDDVGTYAKVTATWRVDQSGAGMSSNTGVVTGQITPQGGTATAITWQGGTSGTSGTAVALVPNCDTDTQYTVTVTVTNTAQGTGQSTYLSTSRNDILTRAFFTLDFADGGHGVGIGCAAPSEGFEVAFDAQFDAGFKLLSDIPWTNLELGSDVEGWSSSQTPCYKRCGETVFLQGAVNLKNQAAAGSSIRMGTLPYRVRPPRYIEQVCQGDDEKIWTIEINPSGSVYIKRYRSGGTNEVISTNAKFIFNVTYSV